MRNDIVTVIDLGSTKAVCLAARRGAAGGVEPLAVSVLPMTGLRRGTVEDADAMAVAIADAVAKVEESLGFQVRDAVVSIGGPGIESMNAQGFVEIVPGGRVISADDVLKVVNHSRQQVLPQDLEQIQALPREFRVNGQTAMRRPIGVPGARLEVSTYLVVGPGHQIAAQERALRNAGVEVESMVLAPLASGLGVLSADDLERGAAVVDIGALMTTLAVFVGGALCHHAYVPVGSAHVTSDVSQLLKTSREEAERLKLRYGSAVGRVVNDNEQMEVLQAGQDHARPMQRRVFCEIVESRMRELARLSVAQLERSGHLSSLKGGLAITGGGSQMQAVEELFEDEVGKVRVRRLSPKVEGSLRGLVAKPDMASAVGLARFALDHEEDELSTADGASWRDRIRTLWTLLGKK